MSGDWCSFTEGCTRATAVLMTIWVVCPQQRYLLPKVRRFVDLLKSELPKTLAIV